jgi:toxin ParE1/3/4
VTERYRLSRAARKDIDAIWTYSATRWNEDQAEAYVGEIRNALRRLNEGSAHPRDWSHLREGYFSYLVGSHLLLIRRRINGYEVVRILHQSMDVDRHLK